MSKTLDAIFDEWNCGDITTELAQWFLYETLGYTQQEIDRIISGWKFAKKYL